MRTVVKTELTFKESELRGIKQQQQQQQQNTPLKKVDYEIQHAMLVDILNYVTFC